MSHEPCTLFCPRSGFTPTPSRPMLPVAIARLAMPITMVEPCAVLGHAQAVVDRGIGHASAASPGASPRGASHTVRAAPRTSSVGTLVADSKASGELRGSGYEVPATSSKLLSPRSARADERLPSTRPSVTITCASELISGDIGAGAQAAGGSTTLRCAGWRTMPMVRGSTTISFAPSRSRLFMLRSRIPDGRRSGSRRSP